MDLSGLLRNRLVFDLHPIILSKKIDKHLDDANYFLAANQYEFPLKLFTKVNKFVNLLLMLTVILYETENGATPVKDFLDELSPKQAQKAAWVLKIVKE